MSISQETPSGQLTFAELLQQSLLTIPNEDPVEYFNNMYKSINPALVQEAVRNARAEVAKESKKYEKNKQCKLANVFLTLGADSLTQSLYTGVIGTLLWLSDYIDAAGERLGVSKNDIEITKRTLNTLRLPQAFDAKFDESTGELVASSSCRHYATFLSSFVSWATTGCTKVTCRVENGGNTPAPSTTPTLRTNMELTRFLTNLALGSFPSIPFTAYFIGSTRVPDLMELAEKLARVIDFTKYMTPESITLNQPQFVVQNESAPLVGIIGHPLANTILGQESNGNVEWYGLYQESEEFAKICQRAGINSKDVKKYMYSVSENEHQKILEHGNTDPRYRVAKFIESQSLTKEIYQLRNKTMSIDNGIN